MTTSVPPKDASPLIERVYAYPQPTESTDDSWWGRYFAALKDLTDTSKAVLHADCRYIVDRGVFGSGPPSRDTWPPNRIRRGLVMGSVQSGKTASMLGLSALALDRGVDLIIVLTGTRLSLWRQTYERLQGQLDSGPDSAEKQKRRLLAPAPGVISVPDGGLPPLEVLYRLEPSALRRALRDGRPIVVVAMKQVDHMRALRETLRKSVFPALDRIQRPVHMLVLDDEADDGSIMDARIEASQDPVYGNLKQIPRAIADLWAPPSGPAPASLFATYVGYTATPQANFLQEDQNPLAPREFVISLRTPLDRGQVTPRSSTFVEPRGLERYYTGGEVYYRRGRMAGLCVANSGNPTEDLAESLRAFLVAGAVRLHRSGGRLGPNSAKQRVFDTREAAQEAGAHSMLIHPSALKDAHFSTAEDVLLWAGVNDRRTARSLLQSGDSYLPATLVTHLEADEEKWVIWLNRFRWSANEIHREFNTASSRVIPDWDTVKNLLKTEVIPGTRVAVVNSDPAADDRPAYEPSVDVNGKWRAPRDTSTIFVSGNVMARGLTLEGLTTTLFLRSSNTPYADTQMQMQRWFGYRGAYIELCRLFAPQDQLGLFAAYHDTDEALRIVIADGMRDDAAVPDPTVLQGKNFLATGKIANLGNKPLCPGAKPFVRLINNGAKADPNAELVAELFEDGGSVDVMAGGRPRGRILEEPLSLVQASEVLDRLAFESYRPGVNNWQGDIWRHIQTLVSTIQPLPDGRPLYRAPGPLTGNASDVRRDCPYAIAAYFRLWAACLSRHVRGLFATDAPIRPWSLVDLAAKRHSQPKFWVGIRYGGGTPVAEGRLSKLPFGIPVANRGVTDGQMDATWGSNDPGAGPLDYRGDEYFDYYHRDEQLPVVNAGEPAWRPPGSDGQILFYINQPPGQHHPTIAVGLCIPLGGPDQFAAAVQTPPPPVTV